MFPSTLLSLHSKSQIPMCPKAVCSDSNWGPTSLLVIFVSIKSALKRKIIAVLWETDAFHPLWPVGWVSAATRNLSKCTKEQKSRLAFSRSIHSSRNILRYVFWEHHHLFFLLLLWFCLLEICECLWEADWMFVTWTKNTISRAASISFFLHLTSHVFFCIFL